MADARWAVPADVSAEKSPALPRGFLRKGEAPASRLYLRPLGACGNARGDVSRLEVCVRGADGITTAVASPEETLRCLSRTPVVKMALFIFPPPFFAGGVGQVSGKNHAVRDTPLAVSEGDFRTAQFWTSGAPLDVRLWLIADIWLGRDLRPLYPRKQTSRWVPLYVCL